jgi:ABC-2 type transport system permease protein
MIRETWALTVRELKHWYRAKIQIMMMLVQPIVWLGLFGQAFPSIQGMPLNGAPDYMSYMSVGQLAIITLFTCMFVGMSLVWDRRFGFLNKLRAAPIPRASIPVSRVLATVIRAVVAAMLVLLIAILFAHIPGLKGLTLVGDFGVMQFLGIILILGLLATAFASIFVAIALTIKQQETLFAVINLVNLPLMFASTALFPITPSTPDWLLAVMKVNPLTLAVDGMRQLMFSGSTGMYSLGVDILGLLVFSVVFIVLGIFVAMRALKEK